MQVSAEWRRRWCIRRPSMAEVRAQFPDVVVITFDHRAAGAGPVLPKLVNPTAVRALTTVRRRLAPADFLMGTGQKTFCARSLSRKRLESVVGQNRKSSIRANVFRCSPNNGHRHDTSACPFRALLLQKSFLGDERNFLGPLMRLVCGDVREPHCFAQN